MNKTCYLVPDVYLSSFQSLLMPNADNSLLQPGRSSNSEVSCFKPFYFLLFPSVFYSSVEKYAIVI